MSDFQPLPEKNIETELPLSVKLEALLFVAAEPVTNAQLATALDVAPSVIERGLNELDASLATRGLRLQRHAGRVQLTTAPQLAELIERFLGLEATSTSAVLHWKHLPSLLINNRSRVRKSIRSAA